MNDMNVDLVDNDGLLAIIVDSLNDDVPEFKIEHLQTQWPKESGTYGVVQVYYGAQHELPIILFTKKSSGQLPESHLDILQKWCELEGFEIKKNKNSSLNLSGDFYNLVGMGYVTIDVDEQTADFFGESPENIRTTIKLNRKMINEIKSRYSSWKISEQSPEVQNVRKRS